MLPINILYDPEVEQVEEMAITDGVRELLRLIPGRRAWNARCLNWRVDNTMSATRYIRQAELVVRPYRTLQLDVNDLLASMAEGLNSRTDPSIDILITSYDLTAEWNGEYLDFVYGAIQGRLIAQSVARYRSLSAMDRYLVIKLMVQHELGHILGMADNCLRLSASEYNPSKAIERSNEVPEYNLGPHCTNIGCVMRDATMIDDWVKYAHESYHMGTAYCPQCLAEAQALGL